MTATVQRLAEQVSALPEEELEEFLNWLADRELVGEREWDAEIERDFAPGGRFAPVLDRVRADIAAGRSRPLDEVFGDP